MSRVGLVSNCIDQGDVELIRFDKEFLFLLLTYSDIPSLVCVPGSGPVLKKRISGDSI